MGKRIIGNCVDLKLLPHDAIVRQRGEFNIHEIKDNQVEELKKFHKSYFDADSIVNTASELKYTNELKQLLQQELNNPSPEFVKYFAKQVYPSNISAKILELFTNLTKKSAQQYISDLITERLKTALNNEDEPSWRGFLITPAGADL